MSKGYIHLSRLGQLLFWTGVIAALITAMMSDSGSLTALQVLAAVMIEGLVMGAGIVLKE